MSSKHKKNKLCPECDGVLQKVHIKIEKSGIVYEKNGFQCIECGYFDELRRREKEDEEE